MTETTLQIDKELETFTTNCTTPLFGDIKWVCEHSWMNTGITLQGISLKRCMKCGKRKQTIL